jgi:hypothetical protein
MPDFVACPRCDAPVPATALVLKCPRCGEQFFREAIYEEPPIDAPPPEPEPDEAELNAKRIRAVALEMRSTARLAMWSRGMAFGCVIGAGVALYRAWGHATSGDRRWTWFAAFAALLVWGAARLWMRAKRLSAELHTMRPPEPSGPPRFDGLGDGSASAASRLDALTDLDATPGDDRA